MEYFLFEFMYFLLLLLYDTKQIFSLANKPFSSEQDIAPEHGNQKYLTHAVEAPRGEHVNGNPWEQQEGDKN